MIQLLPKQSGWIPKKTVRAPCETFVVDVLVNITDPDPINSPPDGFYGFEYFLFWNDSIIVLTDYQPHIPPWVNYNVIKNEVGVWPDGPKAGLCYHRYTVKAVAPSSPWTGVTSLCTYLFHFVGNDSCTLDIQDDKLADDTYSLIDHTTVDGYVQQPILGDVNRDGNVDVYDVATAAAAFASRPGAPNWDERADIWPEPWGDDLVDIFDLVLIGMHYGETDC